jgi:hypothetical protein
MERFNANEVKKYLGSKWQSALVTGAEIQE